MKTSLTVGCSVALLLTAGAVSALDLPESPTSAEALARQGHQLAEQGQVDAALEAFDKSLAIDPRQTQALFNRGQIRLQKGETRDAIADLDLAVSQDHTNPRYLGARCVARVIANRTEAGMADCDAAIAYSKGHKANALIARGQAYLVLKQNESALADFKAALAEAPNAMRALYGQGIARLRLGDNQGSADVQAAVNRLPGASREYVLSSLR